MRLLHATQADNTSILLELGCGEGTFLRCAAQKFKCRCVGIEIRPYLVDKAEKLVDKADLAPLISIINSDMRSELSARFLRTASVVVMYLSVEMLLAMIPFFEKHLSIGTSSAR